MARQNMVRPPLFTAQAGDEAFERGGKIAHRSGREEFAASDEGHEEGPGKPARVMPADEVKLISVGEID